MKININIDDRNKFFFKIVILCFVVLIFKSFYLTTIKGDEYSEIADNKIYKKISIDAPRGEIRDRNGTLLAGNKPVFSVEISANEIEAETINGVVSDVVDILENSGEKIKDEFPIVITDNGYEYTFDKKVSEWKKANSIPANFTAEQTFDYMVDTLTSNGVISLDQNDTVFDIQSKIIEAGYFPPISVEKMEFSENVKKQEWLTKYLKKYVDEEEDIYKTSAREAFVYVRKYYGIDESLGDKEARKIMMVRDLIRSKGYYQYEPTIISEDISKESVSKIEENAMNLPGISVKTTSVRYYPEGSSAAHILGQLGKIASQNEIDKYVKEKSYAPTDMIGKTGIEKKYEDILNGKKGYTKVQVDVSGRMIETLERVDPEIGSTVYLTIDSKLQEVAEASLKKTLKTIQSGGTYDSVWGNMRMRDNRRVYSKAQSGAVVVLDVKTGEVLALANYPDYDPNLFAQGISTQDMNSLMPLNMNDPIAPKPLYNIATMTSVQPGSTFKPITGLAALENGLDPYYQILDKGYIEMGGRTFGCWIWNERKGNHGYENLMDALRDSCNYYFYCISVGYNYATDAPLPVKMKADEILKYSKMFGLDQKTGIQIEEIPGKVPDPESKAKSVASRLEADLNRRMRTYFEKFDNKSEKYDQAIATIVGWMPENPTRGEIMNRLGELGVKEQYIEEVTDVVKYSYFNQGKWQTGDTFNLSIGQGEHAYTPIQLANYVAAIANGGYLNKVTVVDKVESSDKKNIQTEERISKKIELKNPDNLKYIRQGMEDVSDEGSASSYLKNFPIKIASKTGTAQKSGRIPAADEEAYLLKHMGSFGVSKNEVMKLAEKYEKDDKYRYPKHIYMKRAIMELNPNITSERINAYKDSYDPFAWLVSYAPAENPEIAVVTLLFQGGHGGFGAAIARDIYAEHFNLIEDDVIDEEFSFTDNIS
ncbi:MAG: penicillin-binding transpeptidase domain-containing protein [Proteocatella sp.]